MYDFDSYNHDLNVYKAKYFEDKIGVICEENYINEKVFLRIYLNNHKRKQRFKKWFKNCFVENKIMYFITLTFEDKFLPKDDLEAINMIKLFLKGFNCDYRFNIDFGDERGRVHFHGLCPEDISKEWPYGYSNSKPVNFTSKSVDKLSQYVNKVVNHAFKCSVRNYRVIMPYKGKQKLNKNKDERASFSVKDNKRKRSGSDLISSYDISEM